MSNQANRQGYDWPACLLSVVVGLIVAIPAGLLAARIGGTLLLTAVVTVVGTSVSRWTYSRLAKRGSRPLAD
jgi:uncharacterized membrane protein YeaQ/YmgE (transglycosylase-associated protein family)